MRRKFWNWIRDESGGRTLVLDGEISDETWFGDEVTPAAFREELFSGEGDIDIWLNSPGGDVFAAAQIYNMIRDYPGKVTVRIDALAASAASVVAVAGDTVLMSPVAMMMIHNPATIAMGDAHEMERAIAMLSEVKDSIINAYQAKTGMSRSKLSAMMDDETWFNAKKAVEMGFADGLIARSAAAAEEPEADSDAGGSPGPADKPAVGETESKEAQAAGGKSPAKDTSGPVIPQAMIYSRRAADELLLHRIGDAEDAPGAHDAQGVKDTRVPMAQLLSRLELINH